MLDWDVYLGHSAEPMPHGLGYHVIMKVGQRFLQKGHHLFFDNYFSSVQLAKDLEDKGTYMTSTIRSNRKGWPKEFNAAFVKKMKVKLYVLYSYLFILNNHFAFLLKINGSLLVVL